MLVLPFSNNTKAKANLHLNLDRIKEAINVRNENRYAFRLEIEDLYPRLEKYGMTMPKIPGLDEGSFYMDDTLYSFHMSTLEELSRLIRHGSFDLENWNTEVVERERGRERSM